MYSLFKKIPIATSVALIFSKRIRRRKGKMGAE
jgi:hypothetical protein